MGCDYIIQIGLKITYKDGKFEFIETDKLNKYFDEDVCFDFNSDLSDEEQDAFLKEKFLTVTYKPLILYENDCWVKEKYKNKYSEENIVLENVDKIEKIQKKNLR
jgi:hypothetical protein